MALKAENGTLLDVKEPIVIDADGNPMRMQSHTSSRTSSASTFNMRIFQLKSWHAFLLFLGLGVFGVLGIFFVVILGIGLVVANLIRLLIRTTKF